MEKGVYLRILMVFVAPYGTAVAFETCTRGYQKMACYSNNFDKSNMVDLVNYRSGPIRLDWNKFKESLHGLACECSRKALDAGYKYMALEYYGECWVGHNPPTSQMLDENQCKGGIDKNFADCKVAHENECVGTRYSTFYYSIDQYNPWGEWSKCSTTCGEGKQQRTRTCKKTCDGKANDERYCNPGPCPNVFEEWGQWSDCSKVCAAGTRERHRICSTNCTHAKTEQETCNDHPCPSCVWKTGEVLLGGGEVLAKSVNTHEECFNECLAKSAYNMAINAANHGLKDNSCRCAINAGMKITNPDFCSCKFTYY